MNVSYIDNIRVRPALPDFTILPREISCAAGGSSRLKLDPGQQCAGDAYLIISSLSASQFGANDPDFLWVDMERVLHDSNPDLFPFRTMAASLGGVDDRALGMSKQGRQALNAAIESSKKSE